MIQVVDIAAANCKGIIDVKTVRPYNPSQIWLIWVFTHMLWDPGILSDR